VHPRFTFDPYSAPSPQGKSRFRVVWFFTVRPQHRSSFTLRIAALEAAAAPAAASVHYRGTYSVTVSAAVPTLEYRMVWDVDTIAALQDLNDLLHAAPALLRDCLDLVAQVPAMRTEVMGRTLGSALLTAG
jgi:hypothetical protein